MKNLPKFKPGDFIYLNDGDGRRMRLILGVHDLDYEVKGLSATSFDRKFLLDIKYVDGRYLLEKSSAMQSLYNKLLG